jgi:Trichohyalin-plectin-homology domain
MTDKAAEQDALRAQRSSETYEREWRKKEILAMQKQHAREAELRTCRLAQLKEREDDVASEAKTLRLAFQRALSKQKEAQVLVEEVKEKKKAESRTFSKDIMAQISEKRMVKEQAKKDFLSEAGRIEKIEGEKEDRLDKIKAEKIQVWI